MFDLGGLTAAVARGPVARVVIAAFEGSSPREVGAAMLVWADRSDEGGQSGTIGGGALEWQAVQAARAMLGGGTRVTRVPLGPALGQCCGGAVTLLTEVYDAGSLPVPEAGVIARPLRGGAMPLAVARVLARARSTGELPGPGIVQGWFIEPVLHPARQVWVWGAGHVGRALVGVLAPLPQVAITWVDVAADRFPGVVPMGVRALPVADPGLAVALAPVTAEHLILTYSHAIDLDLCHRLLAHGFARAGLIGSGTKWARFRSRLAALGHDAHSISRIDCPIGDPSLGKHPQAIAVGVAAEFLKARTDAARIGAVG
ncbi:MAG: xanthine dehydrogenase accessory protein XdhC [Pseudomonadota bacterium]